MAIANVEQITQDRNEITLIACLDYNQQEGVISLVVSTVNEIFYSMKI